MKNSRHDPAASPSSSSGDQPRFMSLEEIAHALAVLVVRQHHRLMARSANKNDSTML